MKIGLIGSSSISKFHVLAMQRNGFDVEAIGTRENSKRCLDLSIDLNLSEKILQKGLARSFRKRCGCFLSLC